MRRLFSVRQARVGLLLLVLGEALIIARFRPVSDFYFPFVWLGYILLLDGALQLQGCRSLFADTRPVFLAMFPLSAAFWWAFEGFNLPVHNWIYIGAERYHGFTFAAMASLDFSFVLPAVWTTALAVNALMPSRSAAPPLQRPPEIAPRPRSSRRQAGVPGTQKQVPAIVLRLMLLAGAASLILPILLPRFFFGLIWVSLFFLLDPINYRLGRPSMAAAVATRAWRTPISFALAGLICGFFWEAWNFWAMPKWVYHIPYVGFWHIFEMPLLGWLGYLPFGLELFAMTNFVLPFLGLGTLTLDLLAPVPRQSQLEPAS